MTIHRTFPESLPELRVHVDRIANAISDATEYALHTAKLARHQQNVSVDAARRAEIVDDVQATLDPPVYGWVRAVGADALVVRDAAAQTRDGLIDASVEAAGHVREYREHLYRLLIDVCSGYLEWLRGDAKDASEEEREAVIREATALVVAINEAGAVARDTVSGTSGFTLPERGDTPPRDARPAGFSERMAALAEQAQALIPRQR